MEAIAGASRPWAWKPGERTAILSRNRPEWALCDLGTFFAGGVVATIFPDLTAEEAAFILSHSEARVVFVEDPLQLDKVCSVWNGLPQLRYAVLLEESAPGDDPRVLSLAASKGDPIPPPRGSASPCARGRPPRPP